MANIFSGVLGRAEDMLFSGAIRGGQAAKTIGGGYRKFAQMQRMSLRQGAAQMGMAGPAGRRLLGNASKGQAVGLVAGGYMGGRKSQRDGKGFARGIFTGATLGGMAGAGIGASLPKFSGAMRSRGENMLFSGAIRGGQAARKVGGAMGSARSRAEDMIMAGATRVSQARRR